MKSVNSQNLSHLHDILLIIDDEKDINQHYWSEALKNEGQIYSEKYEKAFTLINNVYYSVIIIISVNEFVLKLIQENKTNKCNNKIIVVCDHKLNDFKFAYQSGAFAVVERSFAKELMPSLINQCRYINKIENELDKNKKNEKIIIGENIEFVKLINKLDHISQTNANVLIYGEGGVGKYTFAKSIHIKSARNSGPFIRINCSLLSDELLNNELFGSDKNNYKGKIESANKGTLFLEDIDKLSLSIQRNLLSYLKEKQNDITSDFKIIASTNKDLQKKVISKQFEEKLFYYLNEVNIKIPPLRERRDDILLLAKSFLYEFNKEMKRDIYGFSDDAIEAMMLYPWLGNVRELQNKIKSAVILTNSKLINSQDLMLIQKDQFDNNVTLNLRKVKECAEKQVINRALKKTKGNISQTASLLGISRPTLYILIEKYAIER